LLSCNSRVKTKEYNFSQVGWTIAVPEDLIAMDSSQIQTQNVKGRNAIEKTLDTTVDFSATKTLISFQQNKLNNFSATITPFDPSLDGDWYEQNQAVKEILFNTFQSQIPDVKIDTSSTIEVINALEFQVFKAELTYPNQMILKTLLYSKLHKGYDFGITITYVDEKIGKKLSAILLSSRFTK